MIGDEMYDVGIIGGGAIGLACAWRLAQAGVRVGVFERGATGHEASHAAGGMLAAQCEAAHYPPDDKDAGSRTAMFDLCLRSRALYTNFAAELEERTGVDIELSLDKPRGHDWREPGIMYTVTREDDCAPAAFEAQKTRGHRAETRSFSGRKAVWLPDEGQVQNRSLVEALEAAARRAGADIHTFQPVQTVRVQNNGFLLKTPSHPKVFCRKVLLCAGAWSGTVEGLPAECLPPVRPVAGQVIALRPAALKHLLRHIVYSSNAYLVPRLAGWLLVGATMEEAGFEKKVLPDNTERLWRNACALVPELKDATLEAQWAGLRPGTPDGLPILGRTAVENLFVATGHFRNGILLTPITAQIMADCILYDKEIDAPFRIDRFARSRGQKREPEVCVSH